MFSVDEVMHHLAPYLPNGISPSPRVGMKFNTSKEDPLNGNGIC